MIVEEGVRDKHEYGKKKKVIRWERYENFYKEMKYERTRNKMGDTWEEKKLNGIKRGEY
jgi:hypothetical protein